MAHVLLWTAMNKCYCWSLPGLGKPGRLSVVVADRGTAPSFWSGSEENRSRMDLSAWLPISTQIWCMLHCCVGKRLKYRMPKHATEHCWKKSSRKVPQAWFGRTELTLLRDTESMVALQHRMWPMSKRYSASEPALIQVHQVNVMKHKAMPVTDRSRAVEAHPTSV